MTDPSSDDGHAALRALRSARQRKRLVRLEWFELAYKVYVAGFVVIGAVALLSHFVGDELLTVAQYADVIAYAPSFLGLVMAVAVGMGLRSGARGGPLSVEVADVHHVLLAPLSRRRVLMRPGGQQVRLWAFTGLAVGAVGGQLLGRRMGDALGPWALSGAAAGATIGLGFVTAALLAHAGRMRRWQATLLAAALVAWQGAALLSVADTGKGKPVRGPFDTVGSLMLWPVRVRPIDMVAPLVMALAAGAGLALLGRFSVDALARRSALVSQLRFAVTVRDLRTVVLLRRQLSNEQHRLRPWFRVPSSERLPVMVRGARGIARFPGSRLIRMALLVAVAAVAQVAAYRGTTPAIVVSALAAFVLGLECLEPFAQEIDQPDRCDGIPHPRGWVLVRHLPVSAVIAVLFGVLGAVGVGVALRTTVAWQLAAVLMLPVVLAGLAGAVLNVMAGIPTPITPGSVGDLLPPEVAGMKEVFRTVRPLVVAVIGSLPVLAARAAAEDGHDPIPPALQVGVAVGLVVAAVTWWARSRDNVRAKFRALLSAGDTEFNLRHGAKSGGDRS